MPYAIMRFKKRKGGSIASCERHNERKKQAYKSNPDIDMNRLSLNYHLIKPHNFSYKKEINRLISESECRTRKDSTLMVETLITASPEFISSLSTAEQKEFFQRALSFFTTRIGEKNIISAVVHMDEKTPHMHLSFCPITNQNTLSAKSILGNQKTLSQWQSDFHEYMSSRWNELERGVSSLETKRQHIPTWLFKLGSRLDKQHEQIVHALRDINSFNAGKKRDKAIAVLSKWMPEAYRFEGEVRKISEHISHLKGSVSIERENKDYWKNKSEEQDGELFQAKVHISELESILDRQTGVLSKIPPEIIREFTDKKRGAR